MGLFRWLGSPRGEYERESHARRAEKRGDYELASLYRSCLAPHEWRELGYDGEFGNYKKVRKGVSLYKATNGAYGGKQEYASDENLRRDLKALMNEFARGRLSADKRLAILEEMHAIREELGRIRPELEKLKRAAE